MTTPPIIDTAAIAGELWDAVIIGTGVAGSTLGHALARAGKRVVFCERGLAAPARAASGAYAETLGGNRGAVLGAGAASLLASAARYHDEVHDLSAPRPKKFVPFIGAGAGGSSALYGMALERFHEADFTGSGPGGAQRPGEAPCWPLDYAKFCRYYAAAEQLYRVRGTQDPLRSDPYPVSYVAAPPPLTRAATRLFESFAHRGLHPYQLPLACEYVSGCQCCQGFACPSNCKNDSARICLTPAIRDFGAVLLDDCQVLRIDADRSRARGAECRYRGETITLRGKQIFLAAGALQTPNILLRSTSTDWPQGLANRSGLVGRHLMRHCVDLYLVRPDNAEDGEVFDNRFKEFAFNDFYAVDGMKLGSVQSFGRLPPAEVLFGSLQHDLRAGAVPWLGQAVGLTRPLLKPVLQRMVERSLTLATIMEDSPQPSNRVLPADGPRPGAVTIHYRLGAADLARVARFRQLMRGALASRRWRLIKQAENNERIAHVCGTCRFGDDPATSVLDRDNRCHDLENLYVVDSSFFPSSGGTNPSLTIAANALRVADRLVDGSLLKDRIVAGEAS